MTQKNSSFNSKAFLFLAVFAAFHVVSGQMKPAKKPLEAFLDTQFWLGIRIGTNATQAHPDVTNSGFSPINYSTDSLPKSYNTFGLNLLGNHMGLEMNLYHRGFSISFQPTFKRSRYSYTSTLLWEGESFTSRYETTYDIEQRLDLIELPLMLKYDLVRRGKIRPFLMGGGFYSVVTAAQQKVDITQTDYSSGIGLSTTGGGTSLGVKDAFQNFYGYGGGVGLNLDYWNIRTVFELGYKRAISSTTRPNIRQNELASLGEVNDEVFLRDLSVSLSFVFPFRFIDTQFKAY